MAITKLRSKNNPFAVFLSMVALLLSSIAVVGALGTKNSIYPLFENTPVHCDEMIKLHRWEGSCCSINVTEGQGCALNVMNGYCSVRGQYWSLDYNSTYNENDCPPSQYAPGELGMPTEAPTTSAGAMARCSSSLAFAASIALLVAFS